MGIDIHVHFHGDATLQALVKDSAEKTAAALHQLTEKVTHMAGELTQLQSDVQAEDTVIDSAVTLLGGIKAALDAAIASGDPAALTALSTDIQSKTQSLAQAVTANTPAASGGGGASPAAKRG